MAVIKYKNQVNSSILIAGFEKYGVVVKFVV